MGFSSWFKHALELFRGLGAPSVVNDRWEASFSFSTEEELFGLYLKENLAALTSILRSLICFIIIASSVWLSSNAHDCMGSLCEYYVGLSNRWQICVLGAARIADDIKAVPQVPNLISCRFCRELVTLIVTYLKNGLKLVAVREDL